MARLNLGMVQMNSAVGDRDGNLKKAADHIDGAVAEGAQLVVLPEFFNTEYFAQYWDYAYTNYAEPQDGPTISAMRDKAAEHRVHLCATIYEYQGPGLLYDTAFLIDPEGAILGKYRKVHPAAVRSLEKIYFRAGNRFPVWDVHGVKVAAIICYDHVFPESARCATVAGAELVLGPFATPALPVWEQLMAARAFENGVFMAPCNKVGVEDGWTFAGRSLVADPTGKLLHVASDTHDEVFVVEIDTATVQQTRTSYPFLRDRRPEAYAPLTCTDEQTRALPV